jgi:phenylacetic acid degradation operon negative regulatory protein
MPKTDEVSAALHEWCKAPEISARSVLVTIFGDSVLPVTNSICLSKCFELAEPFGFSERLVRTSLFRLAAEGWVTRERAGRRSRYTLTSLAPRESATADRRIYANPTGEWDGSWTLVLLDTSPQDRDLLAKHLAWQGFVELGRGVVASPTAMPVDVADLANSIGLSRPPTVMTAAFDDLEQVVAGALFADAFQITKLARAFDVFVERYQPFVTSARRLAPLDAYAVRTMLIHDFRRIRLRMSDIPTQLLPSTWPGNSAYKLASSLYHQLSPRTAEALTQILGADYPTKMPARFTT